MFTEYNPLFTELARANEIFAEQVMELNRQKNDEEGTKSAEIIRDNFAKLYDKLKNNSDLTKIDFAALLLGAKLVVSNMETKIKNFQSSINGYNLEIIPKLQKVIDNANNDEEAMKIANEIFSTNT